MHRASAGKCDLTALVELKRGHGWILLPTISDNEARGERYRFPVLVESAAFDAEWAAGLGRRPEVMFEKPSRYSIWTPPSTRDPPPPRRSATC
jgi:hypothetical protein